MYQILNEKLSLEAIALLYATFDRRVQANLVSSRIVTSIEIEAPKSRKHWHIMYFLKSLKSLDNLVLGRNANITLAGMLELGSLPISRLTLQSGSYISWVLPRMPFAVKTGQQPASIGAPYPRGKLLSDVIQSEKLDFAYLFPTLEHLQVQNGSYIQVYPKNLQSLHISDMGALHFQSLYRTFPTTLTDLRLSGFHISESSFQVGPFTDCFPLLKILHINIPAEWAPSKPFKFPSSLTEVVLMLSHEKAHKISDQSIFPWRDSNLHILRINVPIVTGTRRANSLSQYDLATCFPTTLVELSLPSSFIYTNESPIVLGVQSFPKWLLTLNLGAVRASEQLLVQITTIPHLQTFCMTPIGIRPEPHAWSFFPTSITHLEAREYSMGRAEIMYLPPALKRLVCYTPFIEDAHAILQRCPLVQYTCDTEVELIPLNMAILLSLGVEDLPVITTYALLRSLYSYLGHRCSMNLLFDRTLGRTVSSEKFLLSEKNTTLILDTHLTIWHGYSLKGHHFSMPLVSWSKTLTVLEFQSIAEIPNFKIVPPNLTILNLRRSPIKNGINMRDMPASLTSLTALFEAPAPVRVDDMPSRKQLVYLNTPHLSYAPTDITKSVSESATYLCCRVSWILDKNFASFVAPFQSSGATIALDVVVRVSGHEVHPQLDVIDLQALYEAATISLSHTGCVTNVEHLPPSSVILPPSARMVHLLWRDASPSNFSGFENAVLPSTLTDLQVHMARDVKKLFAVLPSSLLSLHIDTLSHASEYEGPFPPHLLSLQLTCQVEKHNNVAASALTLPRSLTYLRLHNCQFSKSFHVIGRFKSLFQLQETETLFDQLQRVTMHELATENLRFFQKYMPVAQFTFYGPLKSGKSSYLNTPILLPACFVN